jgi:hypothetical protein
MGIQWLQKHLLTPAPLLHSMEERELRRNFKDSVKMRNMQAR